MKTPALSLDKLRFISKSFQAQYTIKIDRSNKIIDFIASVNPDIKFQHDINEYVNFDIFKIVSESKDYHSDFIQTLDNIINYTGAGLCAINSFISTDKYLNLPSIYFILIIVEKDLDNNFKTIKIYNYLEITNYISELFCENLTGHFFNLSSKLKDNVITKSIYFAYESLKSLKTFIPTKNAEKINQHDFAEMIFNFHKSRKINRNSVTPQNFFYTTQRHVSMDKEQKIQNLSLDSLNSLGGKNCIPFNSLDKNYIIQLS